MTPAPDANLLVRILTEAVLGATLRSIWGIKVTGVERIPRSGPLLLACNHASVLDAPLLCVASAAFRRPYGLGKKELFGNPAAAWFFRGLGIIPLDRRGDVTAMRGALELLGRGGALVVFPEGTRLAPGETRAPKAGISFLAARTGARVLPVRVVGTAEFPRAFPLEVRFGSPIPPPASESREGGLAFARLVMDAVYSL